MLRTRLWVGSLLATGAAGALLLDQQLAPHYPITLTLLLVVGIFATRELLGLLPATTRPQLVLALPAVWLLLVAHWLPQIPELVVSPWAVVVATLAGAILVLFLLEMWQYREPGIASGRIANTLFVLAYLGILPGFLARIRLDIPASGAALLATIFVPKFTDVGAYLTGRALGRTPLTRRLSPKKTWEGFAGGLVFGLGTALGFHAWTDVFSRGLIQAIAFGLILAVLGTLGDLAESMIKRDGMLKDSSQAIPGFGGILDVIDSVIFVAPVAYWLLIL